MRVGWAARAVATSVYASVFASVFVASMIALGGAGCSREPGAEPVATSGSASASHSGRGAYDRGQAMLREAALCETDHGLVFEHCTAACDLGHSNSCGFAGILLQRRGDRARGQALCDRACDGGSGIGCEAAGRLLEARRYLRVHCDQRHPQSCLTLSEMYEDGRGGPPDRGLAAHFARTACALGSQEACSAAPPASPPPPEP